MIDWTASMKQSFEFYKVNPSTWEKDSEKLTTVKSCTINRDSSAETLGSATFELTESIGECYIRVYLVATQNGVTERFALGTFLVQTPIFSFDGKVSASSADAYTPLIELKEKPVPLGYTIRKYPLNYDADADDPMPPILLDTKTDIIDLVATKPLLWQAAELVRDSARAPVIYQNTDDNDTKLYQNFVADPNDTWLSYLSDLVAHAKHTFTLDELGQIGFAPIRDITSLQPVWTYSDDNSSILYPDISLDRDLYNIPNVVNVTYSKGNRHFTSTKTNDDPNSPTSTISRGREIVHRVTNPGFQGLPSQEYVDEYAVQLLRDLSTIEHTITYSHGYCPVRLFDCVRLNYNRANLTNIKAKVIRQTIECTTSCRVTETAVYTSSLWG